MGTSFSTDIPRPEVQQLNRKFQQRHGTLPDLDAAYGYDAVKVLAFAMTKAGTVEPDKVADALRSIKDWPGVTGPHTFDAKGDVPSKPVVLKVVRNGVLRFLSAQAGGQKPTGGAGSRAPQEPSRSD